MPIGCTESQTDRGSREGGDSLSGEMTTSDSADHGAGDILDLVDRQLTFRVIDTLFASELLMMDRFGRENVTQGLIHVGEGETLPATILYADDPRRRLMVAWKDNLNGADPERVVIEGEASLWSVAPGFSVGTTLDSLERLNGRPFELLGFEWDYAGTVVDWKGGVIESLNTDTDWLVVRLAPEQKAWEELGQEETEKIMGDEPFSSENRTMQGVRPTVSQIMMISTREG